MLHPSFNTSFIIPVLKGHVLDSSNYTGISVASVNCLSWSSQISSSNHFMTACMAYRVTLGKVSAPLMFPFILQEWCREDQYKGYVAFLDARKAFDTVWHSGLFMKLFNYSLIFGSLLIIAMYRHLSSQVEWQDSISRHFSVSQGVRQGALPSPHSYK